MRRFLDFALVAASIAGRVCSFATALHFDVASVKPASLPAGVSLGEGDTVKARKGSGVQIPRNSGGPGTDSPGRIRYPFISLMQLLKRGWDSYYEIQGPGWLDTQVVAVDARMPESTTREQFQEMLRNLIIERFGLKYHTGAKDVTGYALVIAKGGLKMKESAEQSGDAPTGPPPRPVRKDADGFPVFPPHAGPWMVSLGAGERSRLIGQQQTMRFLAQWLGRRLGAIVNDATGLTAKYDFTVTYAGEPDTAVVSPPQGAEPGADLFGALQSQLGVRLEKRKLPVEVMVIDRMEKRPKGN